MYSFLLRRKAYAIQTANQSLNVGIPSICPNLLRIAHSILDRKSPSRLLQR